MFYIEHEMVQFQKRTKKNFKITTKITSQSILAAPREKVPDGTKAFTLEVSTVFGSALFTLALVPFGTNVGAFKLAPVFGMNSGALKLTPIFGTNSGTFAMDIPPIFGTNSGALIGGVVFGMNAGAFTFIEGAATAESDATIPGVNGFAVGSSVIDEATKSAKSTPILGTREGPPSDDIDGDNDSGPLDGLVCPPPPHSFSTDPPIFEALVALAVHVDCLSPSLWPQTEPPKAKLNG